jgi:hypothetical protein
MQGMTHLTSAAWHLGPLHPFAQALVALVAFGPFVVLGVVVYVVRRRDVAAEEAGAAAEDAGEPGERAEGHAAEQRRSDPGASTGL